ncbi:MAG: hypothetical protein QG656_2061 [Candidatus Hydrogenedentes bacterium]|nr:hypothetical protein [Candidatus Hydrogenedentota bacterium]
MTQARAHRRLENVESSEYNDVLSILLYEGLNVKVRWFWKVAPLAKPKDIGPRALFRVLWCSAGAAFILLIEHVGGTTPQWKPLVALVLAVTGLGAVVDALWLLAGKRLP